MSECCTDERRVAFNGVTGNNAVHLLQLKYIHLLTLISLVLSTSTLFAAAPESLSSGYDNRHGDPRVEDQLTVEASRVFLHRLFDKYGDASTAPTDGKGVVDRSSPEMMMTFEGFEHLLESLGLGDIRIADHIIDDHRRSTDAVTNAAQTGQFRRLHEHDETGWHRHQQKHDRQNRSARDDNSGSHPNTDEKHKTATPASEPSSEVEDITDSSPSTPVSTGDHLLRGSRRRKSRTVDEEKSTSITSEGAIVLQKVNHTVYNE